MQNVELLPAAGYLPLYARGSVTADGTTSAIQFDTHALPDGPVTVRVAAFNVPAGQQAGSEITAMPARTWNIKNNSAPAFSATLESASATDFYKRPAPYDVLNFSVSGVGMENVELVSGNDPNIIYGRFVISPDKTSATLSFQLSGPYENYYLRVLAWNQPAGQGGNMIEVMPPTYFNKQIPLDCPAGVDCSAIAP